MPIEPKIEQHLGHGQVQAEKQTEVAKSTSAMW